MQNFQLWKELIQAILQGLGLEIVLLEISDLFYLSEFTEECNLAVNANLVDTDVNF